jgi:predicted RNA binding protein YcfA (HicA-like mRNA interferase family)
MASMRSATRTPFPAAGCGRWCNEDGTSDPVTTAGYRPLVSKASQVLAALKRDGWVEVRRSGSHRTLEKGGRRSHGHTTMAMISKPGPRSNCEGFRLHAR